MPNQIRVLISDTYKLIRRCLRIVLGKEEDIEVIGEAASCSQTIKSIRELKPDVVLLDIQMLDQNGVNVLREIKNENPETKTLLLTKSTDVAKIFTALKAGAKGYLQKDANIPDLVKAIHAVHQGELWIERKLLARYFDEEASATSLSKASDGSAEHSLTSRELEVLCCLAEGCTNKEIAQMLFISEKTVKSHLNSVFRKLNFTHRFQAIVFAIQKGLTLG